jgi:multisubunit Na+/H+ antiporter MnhB subunit
MNADVSKDLTELDTRWRAREREWARRLGRLRLGVEPLEEQLARYRRTTWALAIVPGIIALMFLTLFTVFGRPDIGLVVVVILFVPMILLPWLGYTKLKRRAAAYLAERARFEDERTRLLEASVKTTTTS